MKKKNKKKVHEAFTDKEIQETDVEKKEAIVIDLDRNWVFDSEEELYKFFEKDIEQVESFFSEPIKNSVGSKKQTLEFTLDDPDQVWERTDLFEDERPVLTFIKTYPLLKKIEIALCHAIDGEPVFIYTYFSLSLEDNLDLFQKEFLIRDLSNKEVFKGAISGDSLYEGDELAVGLYKAMLVLRSPEDIPEEEFLDFQEIRELTIEDADEIWRSMDLYGNYLVHFIKEYEDTDTSENFYYVVTTQEDPVSDSNVLLFSFPTKDTNLLVRYRVGENLQADAITQEESH